MTDAAVSGRGRYLGTMYIARRKCGKVSAMCWDGQDKATADHVAHFIKRGDSVERMERYENDPQLEMEWVCWSGCTDCMAPHNG